MIVHVPDHVRVGPSGHAEVANGLDLDPTIPQRRNEAWISELFVKYEERHTWDTSETRSRLYPAD